MKLKTAFIIQVFLLLYLNVSSQSTIDSLKSALNKAGKAHEAKYLNDLARECFYAGLTEDCIKYAEMALKSADKQKNNTEKARAYINLAIVYSSFDEISKSKNYALQAISIAKTLKDKSNLGEAYHLMGILNDQSGNYDQALEYYQKALTIREELDDQIGIAKTLNGIGQIYSNKSQFDKAIEYYQKSLKIKEKLEDKRGVAILYYNISNSYLNLDKYDLAMDNLQNALNTFEAINQVEYISNCYNLYGIIFQKMNNLEKALEYYQKSLKITEETGNKRGVSDAYTNIGIVYSLKNESKKSIEYFEKALKIKREINDKAGIAVCLQNIGLAYQRLNENAKALEYYKNAYEINQMLDNKKEMASNLLAIGNIYKDIKQYPSAYDYYNQSLSISYQVGSLEIRKNTYLSLYQLAKTTGDYVKALDYHELYSQVNDSLLNENLFRQISELQTKYETEKNKQMIELLNKDKEIQATKLARQRTVIVFFVVGLVLVLILVIVILQSLQRKKRDNAIIAREKAKVEELLLNILPVKVVNDLKEKGSTQPEGFENVSVFFSDIVGFTKASATMDPDELISELNDMFTAFDDIFVRHECERIKTIGDAYMAVCGMPVRNEKHAENIVNAAVDVIRYLNERNATHQHKWNIRIGINSGRAVGGIVGVRKYLYDVFGDTVNTASRMESNSEVMRINVSENTYHLLKDKYNFTERPPLEVKGKGLMNMYFLETNF